MKCKRYQKILVLYLDNQLTKKNKNKVEKHLQECANCRQVFDEFKKVIDTLSSLPEQQIPNGLLEHIFTNLQQVTPESNFKLLIERVRLFFTSKVIKVLFPPVVFAAIIFISIIYFLPRYSAKQKIEIFLPQVSRSVSPPQNVVKGKTEYAPTEVVKIKNDLPKKDIVLIEEMVIVSAKLQVESYRLRDDTPQVVIRGTDKSLTQKAEDKSIDELFKLTLSFFELTDELKVIYKRRHNRYPALKQLKLHGYIGEGNKAQLVILEEEKELVSYENRDRQRLLEILSQQYIEKRKIPPVFKTKVLKETEKLLTKVFQEMCEVGEFIQTFDGEWIKKDK